MLIKSSVRLTDLAERLEFRKVDSLTSTSLVVFEIVKGRLTEINTTSLVVFEIVKGRLTEINTTSLVVFEIVKGRLTEINSWHGFLGGLPAIIFCCDKRQ